MTEPVPAPTRRAANGGPKELFPSVFETWSRTSVGRRYLWEIGIVIVVKLALLILLWFVFIKPWIRPAAAPGTVVQQFYASSPASRHD